MINKSIKLEPKPRGESVSSSIPRPGPWNRTRSALLRESSAFPRSRKALKAWAAVSLAGGNPQDKSWCFTGSALSGQVH